jgi:co-chaperonin GroES (HSP10)
MEIEAIYNAVIVKTIDSEETYSGNIIVPDLGKENNQIAEVVSVGPGHYSATGVFIETTLKVGDKVILPTMGFTKVEFKGNEYLVGIENQCLGRIK